MTETRTQPGDPRRSSALGRMLRSSAFLGLASVLSGCNMVVMNPSGDVAVQQKNLIITSTALMLLVIVPVIAMTFLFAWRYRASNPDSTYDPEFHHSTQLEVVIWTIPLLIIIALGAITWVSTHVLDPYRPLSRIGPNRPVAAGTKPLEVQVVSLDWKWLFIYPELGIASVNEMAAPVDRPIAFKLTSSSVWNTFYVPALAGMIYTMPGMETQLQAVINKEGDFQGMSAQYSGPGFSRMNFRFRGVSPQGFDEWVAKAKADATSLDRQAYLKLEKPSEADPVRYFGKLETGIFGAILGMCVQDGKMCVAEMHHIDRSGGGGRESDAHRERLGYDNRRLEAGEAAPSGTSPASGRPARSETPPAGVAPRREGEGGSGLGGRSTEPAQAPATSPSGGDAPAPPQLTNPPAAPHKH